MVKNIIAAHQYEMQSLLIRIVLIQYEQSIQLGNGKLFAKRRRIKNDPTSSRSRLQDNPGLRFALTFNALETIGF